ncbi:uncharacterized protein LOC129756955 [Uranotaenia lowii]|uniref:uncharacterized protein LOC129756955 n=1 Tax=Uranotaenia lowii TaxID=190385 RepID=UPI00247A96C5|nr:uncharacterized protein LOC129756955 [Uranotaenia lowii]
MASNHLPAYALEKVKQIATEHGFTEGSYRLETEPGPLNGFIGQMVRVSIQDDDTGKKLTLMCKVPLEDRDLRERFNSMALFEREIFVYREIFPELERIQLEHGLRKDDPDGFWNYPSCYWASYDGEREEAILIMEDLRERDLELKNFLVPLDFDHCRAVFEVLGRLNACSFALKEQKPKVFAKIKKLNDLLCTAMMTSQTKPLSNRNCKLAASVFTEENEIHLRDKLLSLKDCIWERTKILMDSDKAEPYGAFNHGDCWTNNIMFGYDPVTKTPADVVLLDFQMARYSSPVLDFIGLLMNCGEVNLRRERFESLVDAFYRSFCATFRKLGGDPVKSFPYKAIEEQLKRFGAQTFAMGTFCMPILAQLEPEFFEDSDKNRILDKYRNKWEHYEQLIRDLVHDTERFDDL